MQHYISQLIEDILAAKRPANAVELKETEDSFDAHIAEVERFLTGEGEQPLREVLGLEEIQFPPTDRLTDAQMASIVSVFDECLLSWNISADMPENIPVTLQYSLFVSTLAKSVFVQGSGFVHLEFCNYWPETCPFGEEYCQCKDFDSDLSDLGNTFSEDQELPF
jgi:hypothetical protein